MSDDVLHDRAIAVIRRARDIIGEPCRWIKEVSVRAADGTELDHAGKAGACSFCLGAAIDLAASELWGEPVIGGGPIGHRADYIVTGTPLDAGHDDALAALVAFNDHSDTTHGDVIALLDKVLQ